MTVHATKPVFSDLDHRLSVVKRWGILHTIQNQSVAEHVHNVVRITMRIGYNWFHLDRDQMLTAIIWAHHHDDAESLTGDLPTMVKPWFDEDEFEMAHEDLLTVTTLPPDDIENIVKLADKMEGLYFLYMERALGNLYADYHVDAELPIIQKFIVRVWGKDSPILKKFGAWETSIRKIRSQRHSRRGR